MGADLPERRGFGFGVADHGAFDLAPVDAFLDQHLAVVARGLAQGVAEILARRGAADADRGAAVGGLHEAGVADGPLEVDEGPTRGALGAQLGEIAVAQQDVARLRHAVGGEQPAHQRLVHAHRAPRDAGADVGGGAQLQQALQGAVLAVAPMHDREDDVHAGKVGGSLAAFERPASGFLAEPVRAVRLAALQALARLLLGQPLAPAGDAQRDDLEALGIRLAHDCARRDHGDLMLRRLPAEEHRQALPRAHRRASSCSCSSGSRVSMSPAPIVMNTSPGTRDSAMRAAPSSSDAT